MTLRWLLHFRPHVDVASVTYDWVHTLLQHGVLVTEIEGLLSRSSDVGITRATIQTFLQDASWVFPHASARQQKVLHKIFDIHRASDKQDRLRCTCSELLGVYGMLRLTMFRLRQ